MSDAANARIRAVFAGGEGLRKRAHPELRIDAGGAHGDRHYGRDADRALLLVPRADYDAIAEAGIALRDGDLGENLVVDGLPTALPAGTRLRAGDVELEVTGACTVCASLGAIDPRLPKLAYQRRGVYARVRYGGPLRPGDSVRIVGGPAHPESVPARSADGPPPAAPDAA